MGFGEAVKVCFSKYADFSGRARRAEYWWFFLFQQILGMVVGVIFLILYFASVGPVLGQMEPDGTFPEAAFDDINWAPMVIGIVLSTLVGLALFLPSLAVTVRRLHDTGRSGWWYLISFVPFGGIVVLVFMFLESEAGTNQYGPDPRGNEAWTGMPSTPGYPAAPVTQGAMPAYPGTPPQPGLIQQPPAQTPPTAAPPAPPAAPTAEGGASDDPFAQPPR